MRFNPLLQDGSTPLHAAIKKGHLEVVRLLIDKNANINQTLVVSARPMIGIEVRDCGARVDQ